MKLTKIFVAGAAILGLCTSVAFADINPGPRCDINQINGVETCAAKVNNLFPNNVKYIIYNLAANGSYYCNIGIDDAHPEQVTVQNFGTSSAGLQITQHGRTNTSIGFSVKNAESLPGAFSFIVHNGRSSVWKGENNHVFIECLAS